MPKDELEGLPVTDSDEARSFEPKDTQGISSRTTMDTWAMKTLVLALSLVCSASISFAQSLPNYGPNAPSDADSFGQPPSGAMPPGVSRWGYRAYPYAPYRYRYARPYPYRYARPYRRPYWY